MADNNVESLAWELGLPIETVAAALAAQGLYVVTAAERAVLEAMCASSSSEWVCGDWLTETQCELLNAAIEARRGR